MFPIIAVVDPDLLISLPRQLIASTGMDALTHAVEAYTSKPASVITDMIALEAYQLIIDSVESAYENISGDVRARERLMLGSTLAGIAFGNSDIGAVHCIAEAIGALFDIPHGMANAVFLPHVMEFNLSCCANRYAKLASIAGIEERVCTAAAEKLINFVSDLSRSLKIPAFHEIGIEEDEFPKIAKHAFENNSNPSNPQPMGIDEYLTILTNAYHYPSD